MQKQTRRREPPPSSFWGDFAEYLLGEAKEVLKILGILILAVYLFISILVGMYHVALYLFWILWSSF